MPSASRLKHRWLFLSGDITDPKHVAQMIDRFPAAQAAGYNGVVCPWNIATEKAAEFRAAAKRYGLEIICSVMDKAHDRNYLEGVPVKDALYVVHGNTAVLHQDNPTLIQNGDFETYNGTKISSWKAANEENGEASNLDSTFYVCEFPDHEVVHSGKTALRMECLTGSDIHRFIQSIKLQPHRQYHISVWVKTENFNSIPRITLMDNSPNGHLPNQEFYVEAPKDWKHVDFIFNSFSETDATLGLGFDSVQPLHGKRWKVWWDDLKVEEIGLNNVLRRPGCPVTVRGENGVLYREGRDYEKISDPQFNPSKFWRGASPKIKLTSRSRIKSSQRLRVSYYQAATIEGTLDYCLSEPGIFADWRKDVQRADKLLHPAGYLMLKPDIHCINQCAQCRSLKMTAGELLAWNVRKAAAIIREIRPGASLWVWSTMFDPARDMVVDPCFSGNGTLDGSWRGLDKDVGILSTNDDLRGPAFFADLGLKQILAGYDDSDEEGKYIQQLLEKTKSVPGIAGAMYTTWESKYGAMAPWAKKAWGTARR